MTQGFGVEIRTAAATYLHLGILLALIVAYSTNPPKGVARVLFFVSIAVALLAPFWVAGTTLFNGSLNAVEGGASTFYFRFFLSYAIPGMLATAFGWFLKQRERQLQAVVVTALVALGYVVGFLISIPWSLSGALIPA